MLITLFVKNSVSQQFKGHTEDKIKRYAALKIRAFQNGNDEIKLQEYLQENFKVSLKKTCYDIIKRSTVYFADPNHIVITILDPQLEKFYRIITYGVGNIHGSSIVQHAFQN